VLGIEEAPEKPQEAQLCLNTMRSHKELLHW